LRPPIICYSREIGAILKQKDIEIVGEAADGEQTSKLYHELSPDVLLARIPERMVCKFSLI
jgi:hypothetical protein